MPLNEELEFAVFQVEGEVTSLLVADAPMTDAVVTDIGREQRKDSKLLEMISYLESGNLPEEDKRAREIVIRAEQFTILNDILYLVDAKRRQPERSVVPEQLKTIFLEQAHYICQVLGSIRV